MRVCAPQLILPAGVRREITWIAVLAFSLVCLTRVVSADEPPEKRVDFVKQIQPLLLARCSSCHGESKAKSGLRLDVKSGAMAGGDSGAVIVPKNWRESPLIERIESRGDDKMPPEGDSLSPEQVELFKNWIEQGAVWPDGVDQARVTDPYDWWSWKPIMRPEIPQVSPARRETGEVQSPIDAFILAKLCEQRLTPSPEADRRTLIRRLSFDLIGLPPTPDQVEDFVSDAAPDAYSRLVDRLLDSPHYGERWARHWLDVAHYGDTHGYDKDKPRPNAWPYRDYVIRSFNNDKPYSQFVAEQIAGDVLDPGSEDGLTATGFIAAGPWDFIGHAEVPESKSDGMIARNLDRDDMVTNTFNTFVSVTVQCARCHNHKFDPVVQEDYYRLQSVFAALDRADRVYDVDPAIGRQRAALMQRQNQLNEQKRQLEAKVAELGGEELRKLDQAIATAGNPDVHPLMAQFGYHSLIEPRQDVKKWVQADLGAVQSIASIQIVGCHDDFNRIGAGFGFPVRFKIELSDDENFQGRVSVVADLTEKDFPNPGVQPLTFRVGAQSGQFVRITATKLAPRMNDFIFALAELNVLDADGNNLALGRTVRGLDSIESAPRWRQSNLVDGYYYGVTTGRGSLTELKLKREELVRQTTDETTRSELIDNSKSLADVVSSLAKLPAPRRVYAGLVYSGSGTFVGTGAQGGKPREIRILARGDVKNPGKIVGPGSLRLRRDAPGEFDIGLDQPEGQRRLALAQWLTDPENPLTWRTIVNRIWQYHFGRGIVDSPNDFGRMGQLPTHPELLDWLAVEFRDGGQSLKKLHRMIVNTRTYRQVSTVGEELSAPSSTANAFQGLADARASDSANIYLWRMNRRKLEAEAVRDAVLMISGKLNRQLGGPAFQDFVVEKPEHSPHYEYQLHDPEDPRIHRRSIYRFLVRSQPQPFMTTLDCADPSMSVDKRNQTVTALQALAMLNNQLMLTMARDMARDVEQSSADLSEQVRLSFQRALSRPPTDEEWNELVGHARTHGMVSVCRILMNLNEFVFVD